MNVWGVSQRRFRPMGKSQQYHWKMRPTFNAVATSLWLVHEIKERFAPYQCVGRAPYKAIDTGLSACYRLALMHIVRTSRKQELTSVISSWSSILKTSLRRLRSTKRFSFQLNRAIFRPSLHTLHIPQQNDKAIKSFFFVSGRSFGKMINWWFGK